MTTRNLLRGASLAGALVAAPACDRATDPDQKSAKAEQAGKSAETRSDPAKPDGKGDAPTPPDDAPTPQVVIPTEPGDGPTPQVVIPTEPGDGPTPVVDPVPPGAHVCERYGRARVGHAWTFQKKPIVSGEPTSNQDSGYTVESYDLGVHKLRIHHKRTMNMIATVAVTDLYEEYRCDDQGMWFVRTDGTGTMTAASDGRSWPTRQTHVYDPPMLLLPPVLEIGTRWQSKSTVRSTSASDGGPETATDTQFDRTCEVVVQEKVTVPAGTYDALRVECTPAGGGSKAFIWYVDGVGAVKFDDFGPKLTVHDWPGRPPSG